MEKPKSIVASILVVALICSFAAIAYAQNTICELTSNPPSPVPAGATVTVTAKTNDQRATQFLFVWEDPTGQTKWQETVNVYQNGAFWYADSTHTPDGQGRWTVKANLVISDGGMFDALTKTIKVESTPFHIPETPLLGTAGAMIAMLLGLAFIAKRKPKK